jgi:hypothetical protein
LPDFCTTGVQLGRALVPLICFHIVEWQQPDRVLRQFGLCQTIPQWPVDHSELHKVDLRGRESVQWFQHQHEWLQFWEQRYQRLLYGGQPYHGGSLFHRDYLDWYRLHTRRWISREGADFGRLVRFQFLVPIIYY